MNTRHQRAFEAISAVATVRGPQCGQSSAMPLGLEPVLFFSPALSGPRRRCVLPELNYNPDQERAGLKNKTNVVGSLLYTGHPLRGLGNRLPFNHSIGRHNVR